VVAAVARERRRMRVCLDLRWMIPGSAGGLEQQARALIGELRALDRVNLYSLILPAECRDDFELRGHENFRVLSRDSLAADWGRVRGALRARLGRRLGGSAVHWPALDRLRALGGLGAEIGYSFNGRIHPELWELPRQVLVVPDIQHEYLPDFFTPEALAERRRQFDPSLARADRICAMSDFTRTTLIERLGLPGERITTTHLAADPIFRPAADPAALAALLGRRWGLVPGSYLFLPAHTWHHKNHRLVIEALARLERDHRLRPLLVCSGGAREAQPALEARIAELGLGGRVRFLGYLAREAVPLLYQGALALTFPSLFEGFGMPVLEAMACGCPVLCADAASQPEVAGDAALVLDARDPGAWSEALARLAADPELRAGLIARGLERARNFSWRRHALITLAVLRAVHDSGD
jgi:glycosyltransferase involved in cell wall biosynthesis